MYYLINQHIDGVLEGINNAMKDGREPRVYDELIRNLKSEVSTTSYQGEYKNYWAMNAARLCEDFCEHYFDALSRYANDATHDLPSAASLTLQLHEVCTHGNGRKSVQFSFATKLLHMINPHLPIYDSMVARFYFFEAPSSGNAEERVSRYVQFYEFLKEEYARVLKAGILAPAIQAFRKRFEATDHTDEKIIDSLIWKFVDAVLDNGALENKSVVYA